MRIGAGERRLRSTSRPLAHAARERWGRREGRERGKASGNPHECRIPRFFSSLSSAFTHTHARINLRAPNHPYTHTHTHTYAPAQQQREEEKRMEGEHPPPPAMKNNVRRHDVTVTNQSSHTTKC
jgi:hypothetical protein